MLSLKSWLNKVPFKYVDFWDVPRLILVRYRGKPFLLDSDFDEALDEYPDTYTVYLLPEALAQQADTGLWKFLENVSLTPVGNLPVCDVHFDRTKRRKLDATILDRFVNAKTS